MRGPKLRPHADGATRAAIASAGGTLGLAGEQVAALEGGLEQIGQIGQIIRHRLVGDAAEDGAELAAYGFGGAGAPERVGHTSDLRHRWAPKLLDGLACGRKARIEPPPQQIRGRPADRLTSNHNHLNLR